MTSAYLERSQTVPNLYQGYYSDGNAQIVKRAEDFYQQNLSPWQSFFWESMIDRKVYLGDTRFLNQYTGMNYEYQKFVFNQSMPVVNTILGRQRQHRKASQIIATHGSSDQTASQATKVLQSAYNHDKTYNKISLGFEEATITGLGLMHSWIDYRKDPICGDLRTEILSADMIMMDAFWREMDLSDCQFIRTRKYLSKTMVKSMLPGRENDIDMLNDQAYFDTKFTFMPQQYNVRRKGVLAYDEFWYLDKRKQTFLVDPETYESVEIIDDKDVIDRIKRMYPNVVITREDVPTVRLAILVNNTCFYDGPNPLGIDKYPFTPFVGYHDLANNNYAYRYQGAIRAIRDYQYLYGYRTQLELDLLAAQFSGVDVEEDALVDDSDAFKVGPGKVRFMKKGRLQAIVDKPGAVMSPINPQITQMLKEGVQSGAGVTPELLGQAEDSDAGITDMLRQGAALTTLQKLFDNLDLSQSYAGMLHWEIIQKNYTLGKITNIIQEEPTNEFRDKSFQKYDSEVTNAPLTATTKQLAFKQKYQLWKDGLPIPIESLLEDLTIQDKDKMIAEIKKAQESQQKAQEQQMQLQLQNQQIVNESLQSKAMSDRSLGEERVAKIQSDHAVNVERIARAHRERDQGTLDKVKAAAEIESMGVDNFHKVMELIHNIQSATRGHDRAEIEMMTNLQQQNHQQNMDKASMALQQQQPQQAAGQQQPM